MENGYTEERKLRDGGARMESRYMDERKMRDMGVRIEIGRI